MKKIFYVILLYVLPAASQPVKDSSLPFIKHPTIPEFTLVKTDSTAYQSSDIPKNKPVVIIYFSPECGHCQLEAQQLGKAMNTLQKFTFVWVSYHPVPDIKAFYHKYGLDSYANNIFGRDEKYIVPSFYKVEFTPYIAVYNKNGQFVSEFREGASPEKLIAVNTD